MWCVVGGWYFVVYGSVCCVGIGEVFCVWYMCVCVGRACFE